MKNYYQILGLESNASKEEIKKAYRIYATKFHPDKQNGDKFFEERFKEILEAYDILSDDNKRANYDSKSNNNFSTGSSKYYRQSYSKSEEDLKREREQREKERQEKEDQIRNENNIRESEKRKNDEKIRERKSKTFYTSKNLIINGMYVYWDGKSYLLDDYDTVSLRKDDSSNFVFLSIVLIIIGILTFAFFIGILILAAGISGLFYKEYFVILVNEKGDFPLIKGSKHKMKRIVKRIKKAKELK